MARTTDTDAAYAALRAADPDVMDRDELVEYIRDVASLKSWCDSLNVRATRRQRKLASEGRAEAPKDVLAREGGQSGKDARTTDDRERVCTALPNFEDALALGGVSSGHVDAIAGAIRNLDEAVTAEFIAQGHELLADATRMGVDLFERSCRDLARQLNATHASASDAAELERQRQMSKVRRWTDKVTGMRHTHIELDPVRDAQLWAAIDQHRRQTRSKAGTGLTWEQLQVEALLAAVTSGSGDVSVQLHVLVDLGTLQNGLHATSICELSDGTPLPVPVVRHMACEAAIIPVVLGGDGRALDIGRAARLATEPQRQALRAMHRTCIHPDCHVPFDDCRIHHIVPWERGGPTDLANLAPLCESRKHHHDVHEGGWTLTMTPDRVATWTRPDGTTYWSGTTVDRAPGGIAPPAAA
ncbi:MAG TPA: HNH endonuclease [Ilumatobacter sp.]|nr:HNH endonuclease [Ilumatobacter sp.]